MLSELCAINVHLKVEHSTFAPRSFFIIPCRFQDYFVLYNLGFIHKSHNCLFLIAAIFIGSMTSFCFTKLVEVQFSSIPDPDSRRMESSSSKAPLFRINLKSIIISLKARKSVRVKSISNTSPSSSARFDSNSGSKLCHGSWKFILI